MLPGNGKPETSGSSMVVGYDTVNNLRLDHEALEQDSTEILEEISKRQLQAEGTRYQPILPPSDYFEVVMRMKNLGTTQYPGGKDLFEANQWLLDLEKNFNVTQCPEEFKKEVAVYHLTKDALLWWDNLEKYYKGKKIGWEEFQSEFQRKYFPLDARDRLELQFRELSQGERSVRDYEIEFTRLRRYAPFVPEDEGAIIRKFLRGLRTNIRTPLLAVPFHHLSKLVEKAIDIEDAVNDSQADILKQQRFEEVKGKRDHQQQVSYEQTSRNGKSPKSKDHQSVCYNCGESGHIKRLCLYLRKDKPTPPDTAYFTDREKGQYASIYLKGKRDINLCYKSQPSTKPVAKRVKKIWSKNNP